ncbi:uncharacterized protein E0L32_010352 [Thyridium curvatum]|uniref:Uncharacterized protein n=1 Tax=Thyridium curvatum TaxID=1093900 RepID=A0A507ASY6_9PEZI|nr:uncharacterized protein E0L32_010352 [Thyridium curvatum]TPX08021.1 hypothetical protein E0L32_010352 [Thyridium curvatum]
MYNSLTSTSKLRSLFLLITLLAGASFISQAHGHKTSSSRSSFNGTSGPFIGFHLGQSYGTSVARFENGTTVTITSICGSEIYTRLLERLIEAPLTPHWLSFVGLVGHWLAVLRTLIRGLGLVPSNNNRILAEMIQALKAASEESLGVSIESVGVTIPWVAAWDNQVASDSVVNDALRLAGLSPQDHWSNEQIYLSEVNTAFASEGQWLCKKHFCAGHWMEVEGEAAYGGPVLYISKCYFANSWENHLSSIDPRYGLAQKDRETSPAQFWSTLKDHLVSLVRQHATKSAKYDFNYLFETFPRLWGDIKARLVSPVKRYPAQPPECHLEKPFTVLVAGEAADTPEFLDVIHEAVRDMTSICKRETDPVPVEEGEDNMVKEDIRLVVLGDQIYGPAEGAAFWAWSRKSVTYCGDYYAEAGMHDQYETLHDGHTEL